MRALVIYLLVAFMLWSPHLNAAAAPTNAAWRHASFDSAIKSNPALSPTLFRPAKKVTFVQKLGYKLVFKKIRRLSAHGHAADVPERNTLSTISLILGILGFITLFISGLGLLSLLAAPAALVTGILALDKHHYSSRGSRTKAILGIVLGSTTILIFIAIVVVVATLFSAFTFSG